MTLADALRVLHEAGRIANPWLPGMLVRMPPSKGANESQRIIYASRDGREILSVEEGVPYAYRWKMRPDGWVVESMDDGVWTPEAVTHYSTPRTWTPDTDDPATLGCALALLREATGDPAVHCEYDRDDDRWITCRTPDEPGVTWHTPAGWYGPTESAALVAALVAVAREVRDGA